MNSPSAARSAAGRRRFLRLRTLIWLSVGAALWIALASTWNTMRLTLPRPAPNSTISARVNQHVADGGSGAQHSGAPTGSAPIWSRDLGEPITVSPVVDSQRVYVVLGHASAATRVEALDAATGETVWALPLNSVVDHPPTIAGPFLYVGTRGGRLLAVEAATGMIRWSVQFEAAVAGPALVRDGVLYTGSSAVMALDAATGKLRWRHGVGGGVAWPIALDRDVLAVLAADSHFYLVSAKNGKRRLSFPLWFSPGAGPVISERVVAFAGARGMVQAIDLEGTDIPFEKMIRWWRTRLYLWDVIKSPPPVPRGYLWQRRDLGGVAARALGGDGQATFFAVDGDSGGGRLVSLANAEGEVNWQVKVDSRLGASATFIGDKIVVGIQSGRVRAVDTRSGETAWELDAGHPLAAAPAFAGDLLMVGSVDGYFSAFDVGAMLTTRP
ncbi:MAG: PQQ-binding-like beta-propeller repeat protein [Chloroflexi bacterium]|nr:PQQ-binding-like beta-propeller repeat protein [Chloroflexota bacterium]